MSIHYAVVCVDRRTGMARTEVVLEDFSEAQRQASAYNRVDQDNRYVMIPFETRKKQ